MASTPKEIIDVLIAEALGEGADGIAAVAHVIQTRAAQSGESPLDIVTKDGQFSGYKSPGRSVRQSMNDPAVRAEVERIWDGVVSGNIHNPFPGADFFHTPDVSPYWADEFSKQGQLGRHIFYSSAEGASGDAANNPQPQPATRTLTGGQGAYSQSMEVPLSTFSYDNQGANRNLPVENDLVTQLLTGVTAVYGPEYTVSVISGAQGEGSAGQVGTRRHGTGVSADVYVYDPDGRKLSPDELVPLSQHWLASNIGSVGFPANGQSLHLDLIGGSVPGSVPLAKGEGRVWYYGQPTQTQRQAINGSLTNDVVPQYAYDPEVVSKGLIPPGNVPGVATATDTTRIAPIPADPSQRPLAPYEIPPSLYGANPATIAAANLAGAPAQLPALAPPANAFAAPPLNLGPPQAVADLTPRVPERPQSYAGQERGTYRAPPLSVPQSGMAGQERGNWQVPVAPRGVVEGPSGLIDNVGRSNRPIYDQVMLEGGQRFGPGANEPFDAGYDPTIGPLGSMRTYATRDEVMQELSGIYGNGGPTRSGAPSTSYAGQERGTYTDPNKIDFNAIADVWARDRNQAQGPDNRGRPILSTSDGVGSAPTFDALQSLLGRNDVGAMPSFSSLLDLTVANANLTGPQNRGRPSVSGSTPGPTNDVGSMPSFGSLLDLTVANAAPSGPANRGRPSLLDGVFDAQPFPVSQTPGLLNWREAGSPSPATKSADMQSRTNRVAPSPADISFDMALRTGRVAPDPATMSASFAANRTPGFNEGDGNPPSFADAGLAGNSQMPRDYRPEVTIPDIPGGDWAGPMDSVSSSPSWEEFAGLFSPETRIAGPNPMPSELDVAQPAFSASDMVRGNTPAPAPRTVTTYETERVVNPEYTKAMKDLDAYNYVTPETKMLMNYTPSEMDAHKERLANWERVQANPMPDQYITKKVPVTTTLPPLAPPIVASAINTRPLVAPVRAPVVKPQPKPASPWEQILGFDPSGLVQMVQDVFAQGRLPIDQKTVAEMGRAGRLNPQSYAALKDDKRAYSLNGSLMPTVSLMGVARNTYGDTGGSIAGMGGSGGGGGSALWDGGKAGK